MESDRGSDDPLGHRVAMRRVLAEHGVGQPAFAAVRTLHEGQTALETVGLPAVLRPATGSSRRALFLLESPADLERHLHAALAESPTQEAIIERIGDGVGLTAVLQTDEEDVELQALLEGIAPPGAGWFWPSHLFGETLEAVEEAAARAVRALELLGAGTVCVDLLARDDGVEVLEVSAAPPRRELAVLIGHATQPAALRLLTGEPGPLPLGRVRSVGTLEKLLAFPGVVEAEVDLAEGDTIEPMRPDGSPQGYILATGDTNLEAVERTEAAARLVEVEVW